MNALSTISLLQVMSVELLLAALEASGVDNCRWGLLQVFAGLILP